jgi:hypothetical protein
VCIPFFTLFVAPVRRYPKFSDAMHFMFGTLKIEYDLCKNPEFKKQLESEISHAVAYYLDSGKKNADGIVVILRRAIAEYLSYKKTSIENEIKRYIDEIILATINNDSTMSNDEKIKNYIVDLVRESIKDIVAEKLNNVEIRLP